MYYTKNEINPYIRIAIPSVLASGTHLKMRTIFDYELVYIERGILKLIYGGKEYIFTKGEFAFIHPGISHSFTVSDKELSQPHIHFDMVYSSKSQHIPISFKDIDEFSDWERDMIHKDIFENYPISPKISFKNKEKALSLFFSVISLEKNDILIKKANMTALINMIVEDNFPDCFDNIEEPDISIIMQIGNYIDSGQGLSLSLSDFENQFSYSKYHLEREFKKKFGVSLIAYRNEKRLEIAKKLLSEKSVNTVSEMLGFSSIYVFSRAFRKRFGYPPSSISKKHRIK
jgi:AraC-like DNA-binding protein